MITRLLLCLMLWLAGCQSPDSIQPEFLIQCVDGSLREATEVLPVEDYESIDAHWHAMQELVGCR